jgi:hypothetical protein
VTKPATEITHFICTTGINKRVLIEGYLPVVNAAAQFESEIQSQAQTWWRVIRARRIKSE